MDVFDILFYIWLTLIYLLGSITTLFYTVDVLQPKLVRWKRVLIVLLWWLILIVEGVACIHDYLIKRRF